MHRNSSGKIPLVLIAIGIALGLVLGAGPASAEDRHFELKITHWNPPSHPFQKSMEEWGASISKDTGGTVTYKLYPSQQLGKSFDHYDLVRDGIADVALVGPGYQPGRFPIVDAGNLPFMIANAKGGSAALDEWYRKYADKEMKDVKFCVAFGHDPGTFHSRTKRIVVPADIAGMKIRPAHAAMAQFISSLHGTNIQAGAPEIRDTLEKGVADAANFTWGSAVLFGVDSVTKYHLLASLYTTTFVVVINKETYSAMSPTQQKAIDSHCTTEWAERIATPWVDFEHDGIAKIQAEPGHEVYSITDAQLAEWKAAAQPVVQSWAAAVRKVGRDPDAIMKDLRTMIAKYDSGY